MPKPSQSDENIPSDRHDPSKQREEQKLENTLKKAAEERKDVRGYQ